MRRSPLALTLATLAAGALLAGCGNDSSPATAPSKAPTTSTSASSGGCDFTADGTDPAAPATMPAADGVATSTKATMKTNEGTISFSLDAKAAPCTVLSVESLASQGYFNNTPCHRLTTIADHGIAVLQCGDPSGTGTGGPGYTIPDELDSTKAAASAAPGASAYPAGTVAMARTPEAHSGGSQFFLVYEDTPLPPEYVVFGTMDKASLAVVRKIADGGFTTDQTTGNTAPNTKVTIDSFTTS